LQDVSLFPQKPLAKPSLEYIKFATHFIEIMEEKNTKSTEIKFRCYPTEKKKIQELAKDFGLNTSEYILRKSLDHPVKGNHKKITQTIHSLNLELSRSGNNINQFTKVANTHLKTGRLSKELYSQFQKELENHIEIRQQLNATIRKLIKIMIE